MPSGDWSDFKELVRSRTDIVQLVSERVGLQSRRGREYIGLCPFHDDHDPSLRVDPERQSYKCWACGEGGDCFAFIQKIENIPFRDALELLATRANLEMPKGRGQQPESNGQPTRRQVLDMLAWAETEYHAVLKKSPAAAPVREYLAGRGFTVDVIDRFKLGFAPVDWQFLQDRARQRFQPAQQNAALLRAARLINERTNGAGYYDIFAGRLMFPIRDTSGRTVAFGGRVVPGVGQESPAKYLNSSDSPLFAKSKLLFALDVARQAIVERGMAVVMEGYADCIMAHRFGIDHAVATLGTALTDSHVAALKRFSRKVVLVFDGDDAGKAAAEKSLPRFIHQDVDLRILTLTDAKDPADYLTANGADAFHALLEAAPEAWDYKLRLLILRHGLKSVDARHQIVTEMLDLLRQAQRFSGSTKENLVLNRLASRVGMSETEIRSLLSKGRKQTSAAANAQSTSAEPQSLGKLERDLLEVILCDPSALPAIREEVAAADFQQPAHRRLLEYIYALADEGTFPSYENLIAGTEEAELKQLIVTLDASAREKQVGRKLRLDEPEATGSSPFLGETIGVWRYRKRVEAHEASKGQRARQAESTGALNPEDIDFLRRHTELHRERANAKSTT